jgi:predicted transcriptional regulator
MQHTKHIGGNADRVVTIRLSSETHRALRMLAARNDKTVSSLLREQAEQITGRNGRTTYRDGL